MRNTETGAVFETVTTPTGNYTIPSLPIGAYDLTVESPGFSKKIQQGIHVQVAQTARVDLALQVGSSTESVTVLADAPLLAGDPTILVPPGLFLGDYTGLVVQGGSAYAAFTTANPDSANPTDIRFVVSSAR